MGNVSWRWRRLFNIINAGLLDEVTAKRHAATILRTHINIERNFT